jgi:hypothetical protein
MRFFSVYASACSSDGGKAMFQTRSARESISLTIECLLVGVGTERVISRRQGASLLGIPKCRTYMGVNARAILTD